MGRRFRFVAARPSRLGCLRPREVSAQTLLASRVFRKSNRRHSAKAAIAAVFFMALWVVRGFGSSAGTAEPGPTSRPAAPAGSDSNAQSPVADPLTAPDGLATSTQAAPTRFASTGALLLHIFAMSLAVPIAKAAGFGGAVP